MAGILLGTRRVCSQWLASYWAHVEYILSGWHPIGHSYHVFKHFLINMVHHDEGFEVQILANENAEYLLTCSFLPSPPSEPTPFSLSPSRRRERALFCCRRSLRYQKVCMVLSGHITLISVFAGRAICGTFSEHLVNIQ